MLWKPGRAGDAGDDDDVGRTFTVVVGVIERRVCCGKPEGQAMVKVMVEGRSVL